jgi:hypothetical protein
MQDEVLRCPTCAHAWKREARQALCYRVGRKTRHVCRARLTIEARYGKLGYVCLVCKDKRKFVVM